MRTRTYYRGPDAVVTSELFIWRTSPPKVFVIRHLQKVAIVRYDVDRGRPHYSSVAVLALWPIVDTPVWVATGVLAVAVPVVAVVTYSRIRPKRWELQALYLGAEVVLYASTDARVFNQVARALRRAMEDRDPHHTGWDGEAAA
jgi:hypothetical protein